MHFSTVASWFQAPFAFNKKSALILVCALLVGVSQSPAVAADADAGVDKLLAKRSAAVMNRDATAFEETVDPNASDVFRNEQRRFYEGLASLPLKTYVLRRASVGGVDAATALNLADKRKAKGARLPETHQLIEFEGYDDRPAINSLWATYVERDGRWLVAADSDGEALGLKTARNIWDTGAVKTATSEHFLLIYRDTKTPRTEEIIEIAERAMAMFNERLTSPWSKRIPILLTATSDEAARVLDTEADVADFVAFVSYRTLRDEQQWMATAPRVFAQEANLAERTEDSQTGTFLHELTHAGASLLSGPLTPAWLHEGLAEFIRNDRSTNLAPAHGNGPLILPLSEDFSASGEQLGMAYADSASFVSFIAGKYGRDAPEKLFISVGERRLVAGTPSYNVDQAVRSVTGAPLDQLLAEWNGRFGRSAK